MRNEEADRLYSDSIVIDALNTSNWDSPTVFQSLHAGGVTAINATIASWENHTQTLDAVGAWIPRFDRYQETVMQVRKVSDILEAKRDGKVGVILGFQNASPIENQLDRLALYFNLGVRIIQVTYHERNLLGNGCYERHDEGLSNFGVDAIKEMNRLGILIDLSHVGPRTTIESIEFSEKPVAVTHANSKPYYDVPRNKSEDALKLMAEKGGVVGATAITTFLKTGPNSKLSDYVDAIESLVELVGIDHVGIGTDFTQDQPESYWRYIVSQQGTKYPPPRLDPSKVWKVNDPTMYPAGLQTPDDIPVLATMLLERGFKEGDVGKILGGNWLRLFGDVWDD